MPRSAISLPGSLSIGRKEAQESAFHQPCSAARRRVVVVILKDISHRSHGVFVAIPKAMPDDLHILPIGIHLASKATDPDMAVITFLTAEFDIIDEPLSPTTSIRPANLEGLAVLRGKHRPTVSLVEVPLSIWTGNHSMKTMIVILAIETREKILPLIDLRVEPEIPVNVSVDNQMRRLGHYDLIIEHTHA